MALCGWLKQSTAVDILLGPFVDDTTGKDAETGLTLDVELSKNGQALANKHDTDVPTHDAAGDVDGYYNCELDADDTDTLGILTVVAHASGALPVRQDYFVVKENTWDSFCSTSALQCNVLEISGDSAAANNLELALENGVAGYVASDVKKIDGTATPNTTGKLHILNGDGAAITAAGPTKTEMDNGHAAIVADTEDLQGNVDAMHDTDLPAVKTVVDAIQTVTDAESGVKAAVDALENISTAEVNEQVVDALKTDTMAETAQGIPSPTPTFEEALMMLYMMVRNKKTVTATELGIYNNEGTKIAKKVLSDDATTYTEDEMVSGA